MITIWFDVFDLSFIFFITMSHTTRVINKSRACHFLQVSNWWHKCWHLCVLSHASNGKDCLLNKCITFTRYYCTQLQTKIFSTIFPFFIIYIYIYIYITHLTRLLQVTIKGTGFPIQGSCVQINWVAPRST